MGISKVEIMENGISRPIIDLTEDSVSPETLAEGETAHDASGEVITGTMKKTSSDNPAEEMDVVAGKEFFVNGEKVIGKIPEYKDYFNDNLYDSMLFGDTESVEGDGEYNITNNVAFTEDVLIRKGLNFNVNVFGSELGNAKPEDVAKGVFFTSAEGLCMEGTGLIAGGGGSVFPDGAFAPVTTFTDGKQYALVSLIGGVRRYINTTEYNNYTMNATEINISEDAGEYVIFNSTPVMFTAVASGDGFLLKNGNNYLHGTSSGGTALRVGTTQAVWTVDTSATGGFTSGKYNAKEDANAVWLINNTGGYNWSIKYETAGSFGYDRDGRDNTYSTGFTPFVLYEYVAGEGEVNPIMDTSEGNLSSSKMLEGAIGFSNGRRVEGNIPSIQADTITPSTTAQEIPAGVYLAGKQTISAIQTETKNITQNGTYTPSAGKYFSSVTVNVPTGSTLPEGAIVVRVTKGAEASTQVGSGYSLSVTYGDDVDIDDSLALSFVGTTKTLSSISDTTDFSVLQGKYVRSGSSYTSKTGTFYYIPTGSTFTVSGSSMNKTLTCDKAQKVSIQKVNL